MVAKTKRLTIIARILARKSCAVSSKSGTTNPGLLEKILLASVMSAVSAATLASGAAAIEGQTLSEASIREGESEATQVQTERQPLSLAAWLKPAEREASPTATIAPIASVPAAIAPSEITATSPTDNSPSNLIDSYNLQPSSPPVEVNPSTFTQLQGLNFEEFQTSPQIAVNPAEGAAAPAANPSVILPRLDEGASTDAPLDVADSESDAMEQVNSVSQLSDVQPTDWAFQALQNLVERYGCIAGYPDGTYRGNRAMTRYEFAAGLNACLEAIAQLIGKPDTSRLATKEDLDTLRRLQEEFAGELASLRGRVDVLEARTAELEANQFSTTTQIKSYITFSLQDILSGQGDTEAVFQQQTFFNLLTSFSGKDLLSVAFLAKNTQLPDLATTNNGREVGSTREGTANWAFGINTNNVLINTFVEYVFPVIDDKQKLYVTLAASNGFNTSRFLLPLSPLTWEGYDLGNGPVSAFGQRNPIYRLGGGAGILVNYDMGNSLRFNAIYITGQGNSPDPGKGIFNGDYAAVGQLNYTSPDNNLAVALVYMNTYFSPGRYAYNSQSKIDETSEGFVGTSFANRFDNAGIFFDKNVATINNTYGLQAFYRLSPRFILGGFAAKTNARAIGQGDFDIWTYAVSLAFPDLGKKGNLGGLIVGMEPTVTGYRRGGKYVGGFENDTSLHVEAFYQYQLTDHISITPGIIWITAPNQDASNEDIVNAVLRTTFIF